MYQAYVYVSFRTVTVVESADRTACSSSLSNSCRGGRIQQCSNGRPSQPDPPQLLLIHRHYLAIRAETEVRDATRNLYLAQRYTSRRPDMNAIKTARVDIASRVALDSVGCTAGAEGEEPTIE